MAVASPSLLQRASASQPAPQGGGARAVKWILIGICLGYVGLMLLLPLAAIFTEAFRMGVKVYADAVSSRDTMLAAGNTLLAAGIAVPLNLVFGVIAAWAIAKFEFVGKSVLISLIDLPFAISPVVAGLVYVLVFGKRGWLGPWLDAHGIKIIFALPGIVLATVFVTFPFVARELIPLMQDQGSEEEQAALSLGAGGLRTFWHVTLPNVKWALIYGIILCNARAMGEFGAVAVVSKHIRQTNTIPLHVEFLYNQMDPDVGVAPAFAVASLLAMLGLLTLVLKTFVEWRAQRPLTGLLASASTVPAPDKAAAAEQAAAEGALI